MPEANEKLFPIMNYFSCHEAHSTFPQSGLT